MTYLDPDDDLTLNDIPQGYEPPPPRGAQYWGMGSFYKYSRNRVWVYVDKEWIASSKTHDEIRRYMRVEDEP